jgi:hypothetical protein
LKRRLASLVPVLMFAGTLSLMQWVAGMPVTWLWLKTILVFLAATLVIRLLPWDRWIFRVGHGTPLFWMALFALFVRHFAVVLMTEARRALLARSLSVPNQYGAGSFRSLVFAVSSLFTRSLTRVERFYAAQSVRGIGE